MSLPWDRWDEYVVIAPLVMNGVVTTTNITLYECPACLALVRARTHHHEWHEAQAAAAQAITRTDAMRIARAVLASVR